MIVFLDFDGVLNSARYFLETPSAATAAYHGRLVLDPMATRRLAHLIDSSGARVVISSDWRKGRPLAYLCDCLARAGFRGAQGKVIGVTPNHGLAPRGGEIREWLRKRATHAPYVVLDDRNDMAAVRRGHVWVNPLYGLLDHHIRRAMVLLGGMVSNG